MKWKKLFNLFLKESQVYNFVYIALSYVAFLLLEWWCGIFKCQIHFFNIILIVT